MSGGQIIEQAFDFAIAIISALGMVCSLALIAIGYLLALPGILVVECATFFFRSFLCSFLGDDR